MKSLFSRKPIADLVEESEHTGLRRMLGTGDLVMLSIGAVIGAGIFSSIGTAAAGQLAADGVTVVRYGAGPALVLNLLRWGQDIRSWEDLKLPREGVKAAGLSEKELNMAGQLIDELTTEWHPEQFSDKFKDQVMALVEKKAEAGETETVLQPEEEAPAKTADVIDLTELLQRSLRGGKGGSKPAAKKKRAA